MMVITMVVVFIVYYTCTKDRHYKCKNAYSSAIIVLFAATILPIVILQFYCWYRIITIEQFFGANFDKCFNIGKSLQSVDVLNDVRPDRKMTEKDNDNNNDINFNKEKPTKLYNNINNNIAKSSQRSDKGMIEDINS